jgi:hypothetical protein
MSPNAVASELAGGQAVAIEMAGVQERALPPTSARSTCAVTTEVCTDVPLATACAGGTHAGSPTTAQGLYHFALLAPIVSQ